MAKSGDKSGFCTIYESVDIEVDVSEVISDATNACLKAECENRGWVVADSHSSITLVKSEILEEWFSLEQEMLDAFGERDLWHFRTLIDKMKTIAGVPRDKIPRKKHVATSPTDPV